MKHRLRFSARSKKLRQTKNALKRGLVLLPLIVLLGSTFVALFPQTASANSGDGTFTYQNSSSSQIIEAGDGGPQTYKKSTFGNGIYNGGTADGYTDGAGNPCTAFIQTSDHKYDGDTKGQWYAACFGGNQGTKTISIKKAPHYVGAWVDHSHISVNGTIYYDNQTDDNDSYTATQNNGCDDNVINGFPHKGGDPRNATATATITVNQTVSSTNGNCVQTSFPITFNDTNNYFDYFVWVDSGTIETSDGTAMIFAQNDPSQNHYLDDGSGRSSDSTCISGITADPNNNPSHGTLVMRNSSGNPFPTGFSPQISGADMHGSSGCQVSGQISVNIGGTANAKKKAGSGGAGAGGGSTAPTSVGCDWSSGGSFLGLGLIANPLNWALCGIVKGLGIIITQLDQQIIQSLAIGTGNSDKTDNPNNIFSDNGHCGTDPKICNSYETAWSSFRDIALGLLVVVGLIVVISQAAGVELLDAYTIRKTLPKVLIATIAITLSWQLMKFMVTISNDLGYGIGGLLWHPFSHLHPQFAFGGGGVLVGIFGGAFAATAILDAFGLMTFLGTAAIAVLITFLVLTLRQIAVILLVVMSPVAILAYVLPNTQRIYKFWWESFSKLLLMFPLIVAFLTAGYIFSAITLAQSNDFWHTAIAFIAYFGPYFAIPMTFRFAGSVMGTLGNAVNSRGEGARNWLAGKRREKAAANMKKIRSGQRWDQNFGRFGKKDWMSVGHFANRAAVNMFDQDELLPYRLGKQRGNFGGVWGFKKGAAKLQDAIDDRMIDESMKGYQEIEQKGGIHYEGKRALAGDFANFKGKDKKGRSIQSRLEEEFLDKNTGKMRRMDSLKDFQTMSEILKESSEDKERLGGHDIEAQAGALATIKSHPDMEYADVQMMAAIGLAADGRADADSLSNMGNSVKARLGSGAAQRMLKTAAKVGSRNRPDIRDGHGVVIDGKGNYVSAYKNPTSATAVGSVMSVKGSDWSGAKAEAVDAVSDTLVHIAKGGTGNEVDKMTINEAIRQGIQNPYNDAGQRKSWVNVAKRAGYTEEDIQKMHARAASLGDQTVMAGDDGGDGGPPGVTPPGTTPAA